MREFLDLMESHQWLLLESPQRIEWLITNMGPKLEAKYAADVEAHHIPQFIQNQVDQEGDENTPLANKIVNHVVRFDPTPSKGYSRWIIACYIKGQGKFEDIDTQLSATLGIFQRAATAKRLTWTPVEGEKPKDPNNIDSYPSYAALNTIMAPFANGDREVSGRADRAAGRVTKVDTKIEKIWPPEDPMRKQATVLYDGDDYIVLCPNTAAAAAYFGKNTSWCTTREDMFDYYTKGERRSLGGGESSGGTPLYIILRRGDSKRWQFHFNDRFPQFKNEQDRGIDINEFLTENPKIMQIIGVDKFASCVGMKDEVGKPLGLSHFSPETIAGLDPKIVLRAISSYADMMALPEEMVNSTEFMDNILNMASGDAGKDDRKQIPASETPKIVKHYAKVFDKDDHVWVNLLFHHIWLLNMLPKQFHTDKLKERTFSGITGYDAYNRGEKWHSMDVYIPKPWPHDLQVVYWQDRCNIDRGLEASKIPEEFRTDENLANTLSFHPEEIQHFIKRLNPEFVQMMIRHIIKHQHWLSELIDHLPEQFRDKNAMRMIMDRAKTYTTKDQMHERDQYLAVMGKFDHSMWPLSKAPKLCERMAIVADDFMSNPEQFHTLEFANKWIIEHPYELKSLQPEFVSEKTVWGALIEAADGEPNARWIEGILNGCDIKIVTQDMVNEALKTQRDLSKCWQGIPAHYLTEEMVDTLLNKGAIPFGDPRFPVNKYTPENIAKHFRQTIKPMVKDPEKQRWDTTTIPNLGEITEAWKKIPAAAHTSETVAELMPVYWQAVAAFPKKLLDSNVLNHWVEAVTGYGGSSKELFKLFPKSAYTSQNLAKAVAKNIISEVPDDLHDDDVLMNLMKNSSSKKGLDWSKITEELFLKFIARDKWDAASAMRYDTMPSDSPLFKSEPIAFAMLTPSDSGRSYLNVGDDSLHDIYGKQADRRVNWTQRCFNLAAGNIVAFNEIPDNFRSPEAEKRAVTTAPNSIEYIPNPLKWLNSEEKLPSLVEKRLTAFGYIKTPKGWVDSTKEKHVTVPGVKGSYAITATEPQGHVLTIFNEDGKVVDTLLLGLDPKSSGHSYYNNDKQFYGRYDRAHSSNGIGRQDSMRSLMPYRALLVDVVRKQPHLIPALAENTDMENFMIYRSTNSGLIALEDMDRHQVEGSKITYVMPQRRWGGHVYYLFVGDGKRIARLVLNDTRSATSFEGSKLRGKVPELLALSNDFALVLEDLGVASGTGPKFKDSDFYKVLGLRGPGGGNWSSLLKERITESNGFVLWKNGDRVTITNDEGVVATGKKLKDGTLTISEFITTDEKLKVTVMKLYDAIQGKI